SKIQGASEVFFFFFFWGWLVVFLSGSKEQVHITFSVGFSGRLSFLSVFVFVFLPRTSSLFTSSFLIVARLGAGNGEAATNQSLTDWSPWTLNGSLRYFLGNLPPAMGQLTHYPRSTYIRRRELYLKPYDAKTKG